MTNLFAIQLGFLEHTAEDQTIARVLEHIADGVRSVEDGLRDLDGRGLPDEQVDAIVEDECESSRLWLAPRS